MYYYLYRAGVRYTVRIIKVADNNPNMVYVESAIGLMFLGWGDISELQWIK